MLRNAYIAAAIAAGLFCSGVAFATDFQELTVTATAKTQTSRSTGKLNDYAKTFVITLENQSDTAIDLQTICLRGYAHGGKEFPVARVQDKLSKGMLKSKRKITGEAMFSAADDSVFSVDEVKISHNCS